MAVNVVFISSFCSDLTAIAFAKTDDVDNMLYEDLTRQLLYLCSEDLYCENSHFWMKESLHW